MSTLIGRIVVEPALVRPAEPVSVLVYDREDQLLQGGDVQVMINGVPGAVQFLQFPTAGQRRLAIRARGANGEVERRVVLVEVAGAPVVFLVREKREEIAMIGVSQLPTQPYAAVLTLGSTIDTRRPHLLEAESKVSELPPMITAPGALADRLLSRGRLAAIMAANPQTLLRTETRRLTRTRPVSKGNPSESGGRSLEAARRVAIASVYDITNLDVDELVDRGSNTPPPEFEWDFGDGVVVTTRAPVITHDYFAAIDHATGFGQFHVSCRLKHADLTVKRTLTIHSAYAICKRTGTVVPHVRGDLFARKRYNMLTASFTVYNVEDEPIVLDRMSITPTTEDGEALELPRPFVNLGKPVTIAAASSHMIGVNIPFVIENPQAGQLRYDVRGFSVVYAGTLGNLPVRCSAVFEVPVCEWTTKPDAFVFPDRPPKHQIPWPWDLVTDEFRKVANPAGVLRQLDEAVLDASTGTLAVSLGPLRKGPPARLAREAGMRAMAAMYTPVDIAAEAGSKRYSDAGRSSATGERERAPNLAARIPRYIITFAGSAIRGVSDTLLPAAGNFLSSIRRDLGAQRVAHGEGGIEGGGLSSLQKYAFQDSPGGLRTLSGPPLPGPLAEGQVCDPDNLSQEELALAESGQLVCQLTDEVRDVLMPARWMNARKGDCILSPGGDGIIGGLMLKVYPPQWYSHTGIMTRNHDEITHSTGSQARLMDHLIGFTADGSDGFEPSVLKYMWPGAVTQSVQHSIEGEPFPDPEYPKEYIVSAFGARRVGVTHNDRMVMIPPLVLKPDPLQETPAVRTALHAIATDARSNAGRPGVKPKYHYRWYCYTDPTIGQGAPEGPDAGWAAGTRPSVCSSYIWLHAKARNVHLETSQAIVTPTDLEPSDVAQGAAVRPTTPDGLYTYSAKERQDAALWLYDEVYNQAYEKAGWFGVLLTDGADDIANQFLNAFANDDADGKDSEQWRNVTDADAVSPDNMLWWDGPALGGLYGYAEPAIYREPRVESYTISRWKKVLTRGELRGTVFGKAGPVAGAIVQVFDGKTTFSGVDGKYRLQDVRLGSYRLKASKVIEGELHSAQKDIELNTATLTADIHLQPPADRYRVAQVHIDFWGRDEENFGPDEIYDPGPEYFELELGPDKPINSRGRTYKWGGEVRVEYVITVRLLVNNAIDVQVQGLLFEGTSEDTKDLDGQGQLVFHVGVGQTGGGTLTITNVDENDDDAGVLSISVKNARNNN